MAQQHCPPPKENVPVVIDNGSHTIKAGYAGDQAPRLVVPTVLARSGDKVYVGEEAKSKAAELTLEYPIVGGAIKNWDGMTEIWRYVLKELKADPAINPILLTETVCVDKADREKMTRVMFDTFNASSIYLANQPILTLYASGLYDGLAVSSGHGVTQVAPSKAGNLIASLNTRLSIGGSDLTEKLHELLQQEGVEVSKDIAAQIKESSCYVALDKDAAPETKPYKLPDGKEIVLGAPRKQTTEFFLTASLLECIRDTVAKCATENNMEQEYLYSHIVLSGGNMMFHGMAERLQKELQALNGGIPVTVSTGSSSCINSTFIGGSILTCLEAFKPMWLTKKDYQEGGAAIVHTKCV